jgi:hypothetical protein
MGWGTCCMIWMLAEWSGLKSRQNLGVDIRFSARDAASRHRGYEFSAVLGDQSFRRHWAFLNDLFSARVFRWILLRIRPRSVALLLSRATTAAACMKNVAVRSHVIDVCVEVRSALIVHHRNAPQRFVRRSCACRPTPPEAICRI